MENCWSLDIQKACKNDLSRIRNEVFRKYKSPAPRDNVDTSRTKDNKIILGNENTVAIINEKIRELNPKKAIRKDANYELLFCLQPSPWWVFDCLKTQKDIEEYELLKWQNVEDRPKIQKIWKSLNKEKLKSFEEIVIDFIKTEFGNNVINGVIHMDEKSPHLQIGIIPIYNGVLSCKQFYTPKTLAKWRKDLSLRFAKIGLVEHKDPTAPGVHLELDEYHELPQQPKMDPPSHKVPPAVKTEQVFKDNWFGKKQVIPTEEILEQTKKREIAQGKHYHFYKKFYTENKNKVSKTDKLILENEKLKKENKKMKTNIKKYSDEQLENLRHINCTEVLESLGYEIKIEGTTVRVKTEDLNLVITDNKFTENKSMVGGFGSVSLLVDVFKYKFKDAVSYLANNFGFDRTIELVKTDKKATEVLVKHSVKTIAKEVPKPVEKNIQKVIDYLVEKRGIDKSLVDKLISEDLLYADRNNNCVFTNEFNTFASLRGTYEEKKFVSVNGTPDFLIYDFGKPDNVYLFESAIDALSFRTLYPEKQGSFVVLNGSMLINRIHEVTSEASKVFLCFDNDQQGSKFCDKISGDLVCEFEIIKPKLKDFNEDLINGNLKPSPTISIGNPENSIGFNGKTEEVVTNPTNGNRKVSFGPTDRNRKIGI